MPALFADECIHTDLILALRGAGFDVLTAREAGLTGVTDEKIFEAIKENGRILVTFDRGFGDIFRFNITDGPGIIIILIGQMSKEEIISITLNFLLLPERTDLQGKLAIIGKTKIRITGE